MVLFVPSWNLATDNQTEDRYVRAYFQLGQSPKYLSLVYFHLCHVVRITSMYLVNAIELHNM